MHARAREHVWQQAQTAPERVTIDIDATLVTSHSEKEGAAGTFKGGYGLHSLMAYCDETGEALASILRPGNATSNTAADQIAVIDQALQQIPAEQIAGEQIAGVENQRPWRGLPTDPRAVTRCAPALRAYAPRVIARWTSGVENSRDQM